MIRVSTNRDATRQALPILRDSDVSAYLRDGTLPPGVSFEGVPADKVVRNRGFWLVPKYQAHKVACMFLVSTDSPRMKGLYAGIPEISVSPAPVPPRAHPGR